MFRANEHAVAQNNNIGLVNIRNSEVNYFVNFYSLFGTQCMMLAGFVMSSISQVPGLDATCDPVWKYIYWITTALCIVSAFNVLLNSVFLGVYGQGMAIRGPIGSMVNAIAGFDSEQDQVVICFVLSMLLFTISTSATYWIMMEPPAAIMGCTITVIGIYYWYVYASRIYNRFKWEKEDETSFERKSEDQPEFVIERMKAAGLTVKDI